MSSGFRRQIRALNLELGDALAAPTDLSALRRVAGAANRERLTNGAAAWTQWAAEMCGIRRAIADAADAALFEAVAETDLSPRDGAPCEEPLDLFGLAFPGALRIAGARLSAPAAIESCRVYGDLILDDLSTERGLSLQTTVVDGVLRLTDATLRGRTDLAGMAVGGATMIERVVFEGDVWHQQALFKGPAVWRDATFRGAAGFQTARFEAPTTFERVDFFDTTSFERTRFAVAGTSAEVAFYKKCFLTGALGAAPAFLSQPDAPSGAEARNVRPLRPRSGRPNRKDAG